MLKPHEFSVGALDEAVRLTLVLPRKKYEELMLVSVNADQKHAIFLSGTYRFRTFECSRNTDWKGLLVSGVNIEVDETSLFDPAEESAVNGAIIRSGASVSIRAMPEQMTVPRSILIPLQEGLPPLQSGMSVGFRRWTINLGAGRDRRELLKVATGEPV